MRVAFGLLFSLFFWCFLVMSSLGFQQRMIEKYNHQKERKQRILNKALNIEVKKQRKIEFEEYKLERKNQRIYLKALKVKGQEKKKLVVNEKEKPSGVLFCRACDQIFIKWTHIRGVANWRCKCREFLVKDFLATSFLGGLIA